MKNILIILSSISIILLSCNNENTPKNNTTVKQQAEFIDEHNSRNSLDWSGTYESTIPCADCPGIKSVVTLNEDNTFEIDYTYLERNVNAKFSGTILWSDDGNSITLETNEFKTHYKVGENQIIQLDTNGVKITGTHQDMYIFSKKLG